MKWPPGVYEYTCAPEAWLKTWRIGEWNKGRIRCVGKYPQITTWINDLKVFHWNGETSPLPGTPDYAMSGSARSRPTIATPHLPTRTSIA